jgi:hypothetical protein
MRALVSVTELEELNDGGQSEAVSPGFSPTVDFKESFNIARHDRRKQDVLHLCPLSLKITRFIQGPSSVTRTTIPQLVSASSRIRSSYLSVYRIKKIAGSCSPH